METKVIRSLVVLGVPGVALGIFFLLLRTFNFQFSQISNGWSAAIAILFLVIVGGVTFYTVHRWAPVRVSPDRAEASERVLLEQDGEIVTFEELLRSTTHDILKINAHSHPLGVVGEYL